MMAQWPSHHHHHHHRLQQRKERSKRKNNWLARRHVFDSGAKNKEVLYNMACNGGRKNNNF
jgi:hypothetical protein